MLFRRNKEMIHFSGRRHSKLSILSAAIGFAVVLGFAIISMISGLNQGKGGFSLGVIGILLFGLSVLGFVLSYKALKKKDIFYRFPVIGAVLNGLMIIFFMIVYLIGI